MRSEWTLSSKTLLPFMARLDSDPPHPSPFATRAPSCLCVQLLKGLQWSLLGIKESQISPEGGSRRRGREGEAPSIWGYRILPSCHPEREKGKLEEAERANGHLKITLFPVLSLGFWAAWGWLWVAREAQGVFDSASIVLSEDIYQPPSQSNSGCLKYIRMKLSSKLT